MRMCIIVCIRMRGRKKLGVGSDHNISNNKVFF